MRPATKTLLRLLRGLLPCLVVLAVYAVLALWLSRVPLLDVLDYEFCFALALVASLASAHLAVVLTHRYRVTPVDPLSAPLTPLGGVLGVYVRVLAINLLLLLLPLDILSANAVDVRNCSYVQGVLWFVTLPALSVVVATAWGVALGLALRRRWLAALGGYLVILGSLLLGVWRFYSEPPVCQYDPFAGYFSGNFYDDRIEITSALLGARLYHLAGAATVLLVAARFYRTDVRRLGLGHEEPRRRLTSGLLAAGGLTVGLYFLGGPLAYTVSGQDIARALGGVYRTPHFVIHYPEDSTAEREIRLHGADAEFRWHQLKAFFGQAPRHRIRIYYFRDDSQKRRLFGAGRVDMAKPWRLEVALTQRRFPHPVLKHELAHAFAASFGDRVFGVSLRWGRVWGFLPVPVFNPGLIEGAAVAATWKNRGNMTPHQWSRAMRLIGVAPPLRAVMSYAFFLSSSSRSYTMAGSFCRWLVDHHGAARFRALYRSGGDFRGIYGRSLGQLEAEWAAHLQGVPLSPRQLDLARERFRHRPAFQKPCIHEVARLTDRADDLLGRGANRRAARIYRRVCRYDPGDPDHLLGLLVAESRADRSAPAWAAMQSLWHHPATTPPLRARALRLLGNLAWRRGELAAARRLFVHAARLPVSESFGRDLTVRLLALSDPRLAGSLQPILAPRSGQVVPNRFARLVRRHPLLGLAHYLQGTHHLYAERYERAAAALERSLLLELPDERFKREALWRLGRAWFLAHRLERARETFARLDSERQPRAVRLEAREWMARCRFFVRYGPTLGLPRSRAGRRDEKGGPNAPM